MKRTLLILITAVALCFFAGCSSTKTTVKADVTEEAAITASSEQRTHGETTGVAAILTATQSNERQNVVIDFTKIEFYPGAVPPLPPDSTGRCDWLNVVFAAADTAPGDRAKPPNVKSATKGRITINGEKQQETETKAESQTSAATDSQTKADVTADTKSEDKTKSEETKKPPSGFWGWSYYGALAAVCVGLFFFFRRYWHKK